MPDSGYQGYIQDGTSLEDYSFMEGTPFHEKTDIRVGKFCTKVYFGPFRDVNGIEDATKEQIGANHVISKSGGKPFTEELLHHLTKVTGKQQDGTDFPPEQLTLAKPDELDSINAAKTKGEIGDFPLTYWTPENTTVTITVLLRDEGTDAAKEGQDGAFSVIGANHTTKPMKAELFTEEQIIELCQAKGKDKNLDNMRILVDETQLAVINRAKKMEKQGFLILRFLCQTERKPQ